MLAAGKHRSVVIIEYITRWRGVCDPRWQSCILGIFFYFIYSTVCKYHARLQPAGFATIEHEFDILHTGFIKAPSASGGRYLWSPTLRTKECKKVGFKIPGRCSKIGIL